MRITRPQMFMEIAHIVAKRSTCFRLNVGAIVVKDNRIISIGYNGRPAGKPHCQGNDCPGREGCHETVHAEDNALHHLPPGVNADGCDLYVTDSPCQGCAEWIKIHGVARVFFGKPYRLTGSLDWLAEKGVKVYQVTPAGYVIDWESKEVVDVTS